MNLDRIKDISETRARKHAKDIGKPCEHYSGCEAESKYAIGYWYPVPGGGVFCEKHVFIGKGDRVLPEHPKYPSGWGR